eukprot:TRINITY_DN27804_c0_g1_i1.p1 TRINITY_DN27804_c0_g1~~TRINITY_DN27804_c0_g1_i1.p1  ORF type:complete len:408 (-),score=107.47 TRINITY_DN27804_c0_g1_i1:75-1298(-)
MADTAAPYGIVVRPSSAPTQPPSAADVLGGRYAPLAPLAHSATNAGHGNAQSDRACSPAVSDHPNDRAETPMPESPTMRAADVPPMPSAVAQRALLQLLRKEQLVELVEQLVEAKPFAANMARQLATDRLLSEAVDDRADALVAKLSDADDSADRTLETAMDKLEAMLARAAEIADDGLREEALYAYFVCGEAFGALLVDFIDISCPPRCVAYTAQLDRLIMQSLREYVIKCGAEPLSDFLLDTLRRLEAWDELLLEAGLGTATLRYSKAYVTEEMLAVLSADRGPRPPTPKSDARRLRRSRSSVLTDSPRASRRAPSRSQSSLSGPPKSDNDSTPPGLWRTTSFGSNGSAVGYPLQACPSIAEPAALLTFSSDLLSFVATDQPDQSSGRSRRFPPAAAWNDSQTSS